MAAGSEREKFGNLSHDSQLEPIPLGLLKTILFVEQACGTGLCVFIDLWQAWRPAPQRLLALQKRQA